MKFSDVITEIEQHERALEALYRGAYRRYQLPGTMHPVELRLLRMSEDGAPRLIPNWPVKGSDYSAELLARMTEIRGWIDDYVAGRREDLPPSDWQPTEGA